VAWRDPEGWRRSNWATEGTVSSPLGCSRGFMFAASDHRLPGHSPARLAPHRATPSQALAAARGREAALTARLEALAEDAAALRRRAADAEADAAGARRALSSGPDASLRDAVAVLEAEAAALQGRLSGAAAELRAARAEHALTRRRLLALAQELAAARREARAAAVSEAARLRVAYLAAEGRHVLAGDRAALEEIRRQVETLQVAATATAADAFPARARAAGATVGGGSGGVGGSELPPDPIAPSAAWRAASAPSPAELDAAAAVAAVVAATSAAPSVAALKAERRALVATDPRTYRASHPAIRRLDMLISTHGRGTAAVAAAQPRVGGEERPAAAATAR
jgi:hypothetical protein